ncbi:beta-ketoacyl synthase N-terminal-like domain-containing protein [Bacillus halotolerans]|uniref:beta-ketoacyl synthase N-terminal-like domain-containing protein n=1 Tax=Bacillus TaxID=1386 RepID=UPI001165301F|nr:MULTISPECIES: beta-ketoacyl synthase N-terminal-like domain-containing protein [Bacillus]MCV0024496.1 polyketide beta-ketoacyl:ACP synthase [Bacillus sp. XT-2]QDK69079.1 polyketide beta-ketoacyl:ACP synthase [Bacillus halotolerans]UTL78432.1 polyketide beta-ketoacyl:ACP synthase [Bacillus halotolerans]WHY26216.1 beta-ketoacyl synthase N-terminal-like domain-containing protein [Bacillus halotolerans]WJE44877.1 beta-ketoacyl synthase N-terminal-like domain-containing protein [Bacillus halotol
MTKYNPPEILVTGVGVTAAIGQGKEAFVSSLLSGRHAFEVMQRPGRQKDSRFIGAEIPSLSYPDRLSKKLLRKASFSSRAALVTLSEAWEEAKLDDAGSARIGLVAGGSNFQQRETLQHYENYRDRSGFMSPAYALSFMDSDLCGLCTEQFGITGLAYTAGGASASGQLAVIQAIQQVLSGEVDICIALGALMDISYMECEALRALGAMGTDKYADEPEKACRPFDQNRDGFIYGECCGALVIERKDTAVRRGVKPYAALSGWSIKVDGNRNPDPSLEGEIYVIQKALERAGLTPEEIDYINPHGTGSFIGDEIELKALHACGLSHAYINATKSITGHGLSAAGIVEIISVLLQMKESRLHPSRNLHDPIDPSLHWVTDQSISHDIKNALSLSMGFGGMNTAVCIQNIEKCGGES